MLYRAVYVMEFRVSPPHDERLCHCEGSHSGEVLGERGTSSGFVVPLEMLIEGFPNRQL